MRYRTIAIAALLFFAVSNKAFALKEHILVKPDSKDVTVSVEKAEGGNIKFIVRRDLAIARFPGRSATLRLRDGSADLVVECALQGDTKAQMLTYEFVTSPAMVENSRLFIYEYETAGEGEPLPVGGGTLYEIQLKVFAAAEDAK